MATIIWTRTDEAPLLATYSLKPIVEAFASHAGVNVETRDISLAGRIIAQFADRLPEDKRIEDHLAELGEKVNEPDANIIKLPNISASVPQIKRAVAELQNKGYDIPKYLTQPETDEQKADRAKFDKVKGSAVNPVLREGNSDRRAPEAVKNFARKHPHRMGDWAEDSKTNVATMASNDFRHNEKSVVMDKDDTLTYRLETADGEEIILKDGLEVLKGEVIDGTGINVHILSNFLRSQIRRAKREDILFSVHLKATMMKVSDPLIFGEVVKAFLPSVYPKYEEALAEVNLTPDYGIGVILDGLHKLDDDTAEKVREAIEKDLADGPDLYMVDDAKGITNLHVPSDVIVDASMPALIRNGGKGWNPKGEKQDCLAVIPDSSYAGVYQAVIDDCRENGKFDPSTMGSVPNVGLMAQKAEEYGSHNKTFQVQHDGILQVVDSSGKVLIEHHVAKGDIWRSCQTKDAPIRDWVKLAVNRARATGDPTVFWLDRTRAHDAKLIEKVEKYLEEHDTEGLDIRIMDPEAATKFSLERIREGKDTISVTGNVLRDYLTDLFPIMELGTSAKMLSVVPLMAGGGLFETGAGGSAPKHVQQVQEENHLRWDSLGEFLALAESLRYANEHTADGDESQGRALVLAEALDRATDRLLEDGKSPSRKAGEIDNRGSHFYLARYWAEELANQDADEQLKNEFTEFAKKLSDNEEQIAKELLEVQGSPADLGGYFLPDDDKTEAVMRPSKVFNDIIAEMKQS
ncbi:NADP-dependent isocitrate dehydrogenase [Corynebacterium sp. TAE3-ERU12]|uniref:NADP-dependent isocitrate dehydrogenase n=1 Tax=Corynebacterium sp. TAE3-ERU12 TaxID=2849491 RepID=UPI001C468125|nr:NADP-dependent isocitrate dehydrogenase [Corynebacterium sp. TAE3-ERU12]MBV7294752.1 NADP-dependent isocitrate dehydrogenase [Corynebacterium sp. TAE3-ERU12]